MVTAFSPNFGNAMFVARLGRRLFYAVVLHPGWWALFCWVAWRTLTTVRATANLANPVTHIISSDCVTVGDLERGKACTPGWQGAGDPLLAYNHSMARPDAVLGDLAAGAYYVGLLLTVAAIALGLISVFSTPTHRYGSDGVLRPVGRGVGRPTLARRAASGGAYRRIKAGHGAVLSDWRASRRSHQELNRRLSRVGRWRLERWGRQWAREDAAGAVRTSPGRVDRWLIRRADPPSERKTKRQEQRAERQAGPADYPGEELPAPPPPSPEMPTRPHLDPTDGPPQAPQPEPKSKPSEQIVEAAKGAQEQIAAMAAAGGFT